MPLKSGWLESITAILKNDPVLSVSLVLAAASCLFTGSQPDCIDFRVLACLFNLMLVIKAFEGLQVLERFATGILNRCTDSRKVTLVLVSMSFFASMLVTNDIALLTFVPLALVISRKSGIDAMPAIILQTLAANIGSSLTPMGNPQNLFIYSFYRLSALDFFIPVSIFAISGFFWLILLSRRTAKIPLDVSFTQVDIKNKPEALAWLAIFLLIILSVFNLIDYRLALLVTLSAAALLNRGLLRKVDYQLLITFVCFFIFVGNLAAIPSVSSLMEKSLSGKGSTYFISIILSQLISNVPCAILLSGFTDNWRELLLGVNIGGMGTIIASLASLISYKLYLKENPSSGGRYLLNFSAYNLISLILFTALNRIIL
ncbi:MAG: anion transporter [Clostridiales bacterium]|nr:anion transporter [Clostridiales bacterium]